jgi:hypothetical protein
MLTFRFVRRPVLYALLFTLLLLVGLGTVSAASHRATVVEIVFAGDLQSPIVQNSSPLPVFQFTTLHISDTGALVLSQRFEGIYQRQSVLEDTYLDHPRFTVVNADTTSILEQYAATGGFYAYNVEHAFGATALGPVDLGDAEYNACIFLYDNDLVPANALIPDTQFCDYNRSEPRFFDVNLIQSVSETVQGDVTEDVLGAVVRVPLALPTGRYSQIPSIPLGGPGGHLSLLFRTTDSDSDAPSLDSTVPGLSAVAMPFYGREYILIGLYPPVELKPVIDHVSQQVLASFPGATKIEIPEPRLMYMVDDAAVPQVALEPELVFPGIEVTVDGQVVILRDITVPATEGFAPEVTIVEPTNDSIYLPGELVAFTGDIAGGTAPYNITWSLSDGTELGSEIVESAGAVVFSTSELPLRAEGKGLLPTVIFLTVEDANGAQRQDSVSIRSAPHLYLPLALADAAAATRAGLPTVPTGSVAGPMAVTAPAANYSFGVEAAADYPPYGAGGADLPGVVPDAGGFRTSMLGLGWSQRFYWSNSLVWERDWRDCGLSGDDCTYGVDRTDFVYYAGHGAAGGISLPSNIDSTWFSGTNARFNNARWVGFASCQTLRAQWNPASSAPIRNWLNSFRGAHMLLGFNSNMKDVAFGPRLVDNMRIPTFSFIGEMPWAQRTIADAWVQTAFNMNAGQPAYLYARGTNNVNPLGNRLPRANDALLPRPFPVASWHWVWWNE